MTSRQLINASITHLRQRPPAGSYHGNLTTLFPSGARWMYDRMQELQPDDNRSFDPDIDYAGFGLFKYGVCLAGFAASAAALYKYGPLLTPLSIAVFYLLEIHTLFLFPLLIDHAPKPLLTSVKATYKIGVGQCIITVMPIAAYMLLGLFRITNPLRNWYIGCLAIVIWYKNEIRTRI